MIKVALIYRASTTYLRPTCENQTIYNFFFRALQRNTELKITEYPEEESFDVNTIKDKEDIILLVEDDRHATPKLENIHESNIPVIARVNDPHSAVRFGRLGNKEKFNISCYVSNLPSEYFYTVYPKTSRHEKIIIGLEPNLFDDLTPWEKRKKKQIINSGFANYELALHWKIRKYIRKYILRKSKHSDVINRQDIPIHYKLRSMCNKLKYVDYNVTKKYRKNEYSRLLVQYRAAIAATTTFPTTKYFEIPAAGCLTFMEVTKKNYGEHIGFKDGINAIFINEDNYKDKFQEYLSDVDNPKWEKIANAGREHVMNNLTNDIAVKKLVHVMKDILQ